MTEPYGQPEPFDPATISSSQRRKAPSKFPVLPVVAALLLAVVAFGSGFAVANAVAPKATAAAFDPQRFGPGASGRPRNGFGGGASGTIGTVSADQMTLTTANGSQRIVLLTPTTTVTKVSSTTQQISDLTSGVTVTVVGTANPDGSVTATSVIIGNAAIFGRGGGFGGPDASGAPTITP